MGSGNNPKRLNKRQDQAYNDGRMAFRQGFDLTSCSRRSPAQKAAWLSGYEHERRLDLAAKITPEQRAESESVASRLKDWVKQQREGNV